MIVCSKNKQMQREVKEQIKLGKLTTAMVLFYWGWCQAQKVSQEKMGLCETGASQQVVQMDRECDMVVQQPEWSQGTITPSEVHKDSSSWPTSELTLLLCDIIFDRHKRPCCGTRNSNIKQASSFS